MTDEEREERIAKVLQEVGPAERMERPGAYLTGFVMVCSWVDDNGMPWLTKAASENVPLWVANGMLYEALYGDWPDADE